MIEYEDQKCRRCKYGNKYEHEKPCIIIREDCKLFEPITVSEQMTTDEAIEYMQLYKLRLQGSVGDLSSDIEAFDKAIEALQQQEEYVAKMDEVRRAYDNLQNLIDEQNKDLIEIARSIHEGRITKKGR